VNREQGVEELSQKPRPPDPSVVARNIIRDHGREKFLSLIELLRENAPGPKIAYAFGISRQRAHQWRMALGKSKLVYELHPQVEQMCAPRRRSARTAV
jgi:hypothetical protein